MNQNKPGNRRYQNIGTTYQYNDLELNLQIDAFDNLNEILQMYSSPLLD